MKIKKLLAAAVAAALAVGTIAVTSLSSSAASTTIFSESTEFDTNWSTFKTGVKYASAAAGDLLKVTCSANGSADYHQVIIKNSSYTDLLTIDGTAGTSFATVTADVAAAFKSDDGAIIAGYDSTLESIVYLPLGTPTTIWSGSTDLGEWSGVVQIDAYESAAAGDIVKITCSDIGTKDYHQVILKNSSYADLTSGLGISGAGGSAVFELDSTSAAAIQAGSIIQGYDCTVSKVEIYSMSGGSTPVVTEPTVTTATTTEPTVTTTTAATEPTVTDPDVTTEPTGTTAPAASDSSVLWEGSTPMGWGEEERVILPAFDTSAGDALKFTYECSGDSNQLKIMGGDWVVLPCTGVADTEYGVVEVTGTTVTFTLSSDDVSAIAKSGLIVAGTGATLTKIELISAGGSVTEPTVTEPTVTTAPSGDESSETTTTTTQTAGSVPAGVVTGPSGSSGSSGSSSGSSSSGSASSSIAPAVSGDSAKSGWDAVKVEISGAEDSVSVDMNGTSIVPTSVLKELKGSDVDLILNMGNGIVWTINGKDVDSTKAVDLAVSSRANIPNEAVSSVDGVYKKKVSIKHNGDFGFTASMSMDLGTRHNGKYASIYYYNPDTKALELTSFDIIKGGKAVFVFTHASDYLVVVSEEPPVGAEDVSSGAAAADAADANTVCFALIAVVMLAGVSAVFVRRIRR